MLKIFAYRKFVKLKFQVKANSKFVIHGKNKIHEESYKYRNIYSE